LLLQPPPARSDRASTIHCRTETYETLTPRRLFRNRTLIRIGVKGRPDKEVIMLDVAFVALGVAVLALMGAYALALRQL